MMKQRGVVAGRQRAGPAVLLPEMLPENCRLLVDHPDGFVAHQSIVGHAEQSDSLFGDVHQMKADCVARDELAQASEDVGVEDVVGGSRLAPLEHAEESADVGVGDDPVVRHGATSRPAVPPDYGGPRRTGHTRFRVRRSASVERRIPFRRSPEHRRVMTTSTRTHRPVTFVAVATTGLVVALLAATPTSAYAIPEPVDRPAAAGRNAHAHGHYVERACFMKPSLSWNRADGPLPRCYTYVP